MECRYSEARQPSGRAAHDPGDHASRAVSAPAPIAPVEVTRERSFLWYRSPLRHTRGGGLHLQRDADLARGLAARPSRALRMRALIGPPNSKGKICRARPCRTPSFAFE